MSRCKGSYALKCKLSMCNVLPYPLILRGAKFLDRCMICACTVYVFSTWKCFLPITATDGYTIWVLCFNDFSDTPEWDVQHFYITSAHACACVRDGVQSCSCDARDSQIACQMWCHSSYDAMQQRPLNTITEIYHSCIWRFDQFSEWAQWCSVEHWFSC